MKQGWGPGAPIPGFPAAPPALLLGHSCSLTLMPSVSGPEAPWGQLKTSGLGDPTGSQGHPARTCSRGPGAPCRALVTPRAVCSYPDRDAGRTALGPSQAGTDTASALSVGWRGPKNEDDSY